ncbi:UNVERIFIED_CONTAM: hypothetical protein RKD50_003000 [Streptomyces canus]
MVWSGPTTPEEAGDTDPKAMSLPSATTTVSERHQLLQMHKWGARMIQSTPCDRFVYNFPVLKSALLLRTADSMLQFSG